MIHMATNTDENHTVEDKRMERINTRSPLKKDYNLKIIFCQNKTG